MCRKLLRIVCLACVVVAAAGAQPRADGKSAEKAFRDSLTNRLLIARGFSAETEVHYQWTAQGLEAQAPPRLRTLGSIEVASVKVKGGRIEIKGMRQTLLRKTRPGGDQEVSEGSPVVLEIELGGADAATVLPKLKDALFYADLDAALVDIPPIYRRLLGVRGEHPGSQPADAAGIGDVARPVLRSAAARVCPADPSSFTRPKIVRHVDPEFSEEARRAKVNGNVMMALTVDTNGDATDLWVVRPVGYGLNEEAAKAVRQYKFNPATCGGEAVASSLAIDVNFQIF